MIFADVIVDISARSLDRPFQYIVPEEMEQDAVVGAQVIIPFGRSNRAVKGFIIGLHEKPDFDIARTKGIREVVKQGVVAESHLLSLAYWMKENYGSTMNDAIKAVMPVRQEIQEKVTRTVYSAVSREELQEWRSRFENKHYTAKVRVLDQMMSLPEQFTYGVDYALLQKRAGVTAAVLRGLQEQGILTVETKRNYRNPIQAGEMTDTAPVLNEEQRRAVDTVCGEYERGKRGIYLLHGVTGSGKTEVYMHVIEHVLAKGQQVIMLIPEIALTFQTVTRFFCRFGERISVMHSRLSQGERFDQFERAKKGEIDIMIGPRSALFTPFTKLGLIVIDEEHEMSYQSEMPPKYHAREAAVQRARMVGASVLLGSATPSLESYYRASAGRYRLLVLQKRAGGAVLPRVWITDLRKELENRNRSVFGEKLTELMEEKLSRGEQAILFLNRRGYAGFVSCRKCGEPISCPHCSVSLTAHMNYGKVDSLECHYCGYHISMPETCPKCGSRYIGTFGIGTQKVEQMAKERFPGARVLRMDADTTTGKEGHEKILHQFAEGKADILVGTQMIVKGHDFPNVTLVGIMAADLSLNVGDYRAAERTYQLLAQAAGRAGRGEKPGDVVLQTYQPEHYSIVCAAAQDYEEFYRQEISVRQMLHYPPVSNILEVLVFSKDEEQAEKCAARLSELVRNIQNVKKHADRSSIRSCAGKNGSLDGGETQVLGPSPAPLAKVRDVYRRILYMKCRDYLVLRQMKNQLESYFNEQEEFSSCWIQFGFNN